MKRLISFMLLFAVAVSSIACAYADTSVPSVFANDIAPNGYRTAKSFAAQNNGTLGISSANATGRSYSTDRHNALIAAGWELKSVKVTEMTSDDLVKMGIATTSEASSVVIEGTKVVESYYEQPRQSKSTYNSALLDGISSLTKPVMTLISKAVPYAKWVPSVFGFTVPAIVEASASKKSTFEMTSTLRFYDVEVKIEGWPYYFVCASSEKYEVAAAAMFTGYKEDGTPFSDAGSGSASSKSAHYGNSSWLTAKAREYALKDDGTFYTETYADIDAVSLVN
ncbi:MAG: hypothetical protein IJX67_03510 [Oscillospiraceae bacterium]|nr:hypothetical protein [Clostridia bacterium]MBQ9167462.1 hypothetical protein [Oscillospiraceae bacterium]